MSATDTEHRRLCHALFDAIEQGDIGAGEACHTPEMTMRFNGTGQESSRADNLAALVKGKGLHRRRLYNDRIIHAFDDGFVVQYSRSTDGSRRPPWSRNGHSASTRRAATAAAPAC